MERSERNVKVFVLAMDKEHQAEKERRDIAEGGFLVDMTFLVVNSPRDI